MNKRPITFRQRLALVLGAKQNQRPAFFPNGTSGDYPILKERV